MSSCPSASHWNKRCHYSIEHVKNIVKQMHLHKKQKTVKGLQCFHQTPTCLYDRYHTVHHKNESILKNTLSTLPYNMLIHSLIHYRGEYAESLSWYGEFLEPQHNVKMCLQDKIKKTLRLLWQWLDNDKVILSQSCCCVSSFNCYAELSNRHVNRKRGIYCTMLY